MPTVKIKWWFPLPLAAFLRLWDLGGQSYWVDEAISLRVGGWNASTLFSYFKVDPHPPLYYMLVKVWMLIGGTSEAWLRLTAALPSIGAIVLLTWAMKKQTDDLTAAVAGLLLAVNPLLVWTGQDLRGMALCGFFIAFAYTGRYMLPDKLRHRATIIAIALTLALYTHYFAFFVIPLFLIAKDRRKAVIIALVLFSPWLLFLVSQISAASAFRTGNSFGRDVWETYLYANAGHFPWEWPMWGGLLSSVLAEESRLYFPLAFLLLLPIFVLAALSLRGKRFLLLWWVAPVVLAIIAGRFLPLYAPKYTVAYLPFLCLAAASGFFRLRSKMPILAGLLLLFAIISPAMNLYEHFYFPLYQKPPWRDLLPDLTKDFTSSDVIVFYSATDGADARFYLPAGINTYDLWDNFTQSQSANSSEHVKKKLDALLQHYRGRIVLLNMNAEIYGETKEIASKRLIQAGRAATTIHLQPSMHIDWCEW